MRKTPRIVFSLLRLAQ